MLDLDTAFRSAIRNIAHWGDTDVFPFPVENHVLHDMEDAVVDLLREVHSDIGAAFIALPPLVESALSLTTYESFRHVSQIDPIWNAYFLALVLRIAPEIEQSRIGVDRRTVFSYRLELDKQQHSLFAASGWHDFLSRSQQLAREYDYVAICDIAEFYGRIYHHRLDNSLQLLPNVGDEPTRIGDLLRHFSGGPSYGLPVGGPAARILAELVLSRTDRLLATRDDVVFCRYADDYRLFAKSQEAAFRSLLFLTEALQRNEGLALQRYKTRVIATKDFLRSPLFSVDDSEGLNPYERDERRLLRLSFRYDPYSPTAAEDYVRLRQDVEQFDILGMLTREVSKSRVNGPVVKRLAQAIKVLAPGVRDAAVDTLVSNLEVLAPALPVVLRVIDDVLPSLSPDVQEFVPREIRQHIEAGEYWVMVPVNLAYAIRTLRHDRADENEVLCARLFENTLPFIQRDIVYLMHHWRAHYWLSDRRRTWMTQHAWVQRALLLASYALGDEGKHWRRGLGNRISRFDAIARDWMRRRREAGQQDLPF